MNHIEKILNRRSERNYLNKEIEREKFEKIVQVINSSPTSTNGHDYSVIVVKEKKLRETIASGLPTQKHIFEAPVLLIFCADLNRIEYIAEKSNKEIYNKSFNSLITAIGDCFISSSFAHSAALDLGLGCCYIGFLRKSAPIIKQELNLEKKCVPIVGLTIGYVDKQNEIKPKINHVYYDKYDLNQVKKEVEEYDEKMLSYYDTRSSNKQYNRWSEVALKAFEYSTEEIDNFILNVWESIK